METFSAYNMVINESGKLLKYIIFFGALIYGCFLSAPSVFAANVTVSDNNAILVLPSDSSTYSLASANTFDSLVINSTNFVFTLPAGASVLITSLNSNRALDNTLSISTTCGSGESTLSLTNNSGSQESVTITPGSTCVTSSGSDTSSQTQTVSHFYGQSSHSAVSLTQPSQNITTVQAVTISSNANTLPVKNNSTILSNTTKSSAAGSAGTGGTASNTSSSQNQNTLAATTSAGNASKKSFIQNISQAVVGGFKAIFHSIGSFFLGAFHLFGL